MNLRRLSIFLLCVLLVLTVFAGCKKTESTTDPTAEQKTVTQAPTDAATAEPEEVDPYASMETPLELTWIGLNGAEIEDGNYVQTQLEEKFNVKLTNTKIAVNNEDQVNLMLAAGEMPDAGFMYQNETEMLNNGLTRTIPKDFMLKYAPDYAEMLNLYDGLGWKILKAKDKEDEYLALTGISLADEGLAMDSILRLDWLEKLNMVPDIAMEALDEEGRVMFSTEGISFDDMEAIIYAFANNDPDGNGVNDTYGIGSWGGGPDEVCWNNIEGMFGFANQMNVLVDGKLYEWNIAPQFKDYLKLLNKYYEDGILDPEFITDNRRVWWEKAAAGTAGWWGSPYNYIDDEAAWVAGRPPMNVLLANPDAKLLISGPPYGPTGLRGGRCWSKVAPYTYTFYVGASVTDEELARILQIFNYISYDKEGVVMSRWGEEGTHFTWSGEPYNSKPIPNEGIVNGMQWGFSYYNHAIYNEAYLPYMFGSWPARLKEYQLGEGAELAIRPYKWDYFKETNFDEVTSLYKESMNTIRDEFFFGAITGAVDIDAEWDAYVAAWMSAGGTEYMAELEKARVVADMRNGIFD